MPNPARRRSLMGYILRPIAWQLALASRLVAPSSNKLITSIKSSHCTQSRFIMDFQSNEGRENVQGWYKYQGVNTRFTRLEYRKVKDGRVKHEFIVARLSSTTLCRFDRRPRDRERGYALLDQGAPAEDSAHVLSSFETEYEELMKETEVLLTIKLPHGVDLGFILAICEAIQTHGEAVAYNLMRYNCYFFSWMIVAAVARSTYNWETVVLSKAGWDDILRSSFARVFSTSTQCKDELEATLPGRRSMRRWFGRIVVKRFPQPKLSSSDSLFTTPSYIESFRDALISEYHNSHDSIQRILRMLLLPSQLGSALNKELQCLESSSHLPVKLAASMKRVEIEMKLREISRYSIVNHIRLSDASRAAAGILAQEHPGLGGTTTNNSWKEAWKVAWKEAWLPGWVSNVSHLPKGDYLPENPLRDMVMEKWKSAWDEIGGLSAQYTTIVTEIITTTMMGQLNDVDPEHLVFGNNIRCHSGSCQPKGHSSLQGFIRSRMQDHFEMVDRFGFGSFQKLITTAEEAMCEIWVASLDIMESGHFQSQCVGASHSEA